jgi:hypothetical protein
MTIYWVDGLKCNEAGKILKKESDMRKKGNKCEFTEVTRVFTIWFPCILTRNRFGYCRSSVSSSSRKSISSSAWRKRSKQDNNNVRSENLTYGVPPGNRCFHRCYHMHYNLLWFAYKRLIVIAAALSSRKTALIIWSIGVIPVPPHIIPKWSAFLCWRGFPTCFIVNVPLPL